MPSLVMVNPDHSTHMSAYCPISCRPAHLSDLTSSFGDTGNRRSVEGGPRLASRGGDAVILYGSNIHKSARTCFVEHKDGVDSDSQTHGNRIKLKG
jgi:hypothetical protein